MLRSLTIGIVAALLVTGCATYSDIQSRAPLFQGHTDKDPKGYLECVQAKWIDMSSTAHIIPDASGHVLVVPISGSGDQMSMTLTAAPDGSVSMRTLTSLGSFTKQQAEAQACL